MDDLDGNDPVLQATAKELQPLAEGEDPQQLAKDMGWQTEGKEKTASHTPVQLQSADHGNLCVSLPVSKVLHCSI